MAKDQDRKINMTLNEYKQNEMPLLWEIVEFSSNIPISLYVDSTVVKLPEACYRGAMLSQTRLISEEYLLNFKRNSIDMALPLGVSAYSNFSVKGSVSFRHFSEEIEKEKENKIIQLPQYKNLNAPIGSVIRARRSIREWSMHPISLLDLSTILFYANGVSGEFDFSPEESPLPATISLGDKYRSKLRNAPSGGGLYPINLYLIIQNVENIEKGLYVYMPLSHALKQIKAFDEEDIEELYKISQYGINIENDKINIYIFYIYNLYENSRKYIDMGLAFAFIEAGEIAQNIYLASTALNLGPCDIGGYNKVLSERFLGIDGLSKHLLHLTLIGS